MRLSVLKQHYIVTIFQLSHKQQQQKEVKVKMRENKREWWPSEEALFEEWSELARGGKPSTIGAQAWTQPRPAQVPSALNQLNYPTCTIFIPYASSGVNIDWPSN